MSGPRNVIDMAIHLLGRRGVLLTLGVMVVLGGLVVSLQPFSKVTRVLLVVWRGWDELKELLDRRSRKGGKARSIGKM